MDALSTALDLLGIKRTEDLLFKCRSDLKGKAVEVQTVKENCSMCNRPFIFAWHYKQDGESKSYRVSNICSICTGANNEKTISKEVAQMRQESVSEKWYHIPQVDQCGFKNYQITNEATKKAKNEAIEYAKMIISGKLDLNLLIMGSTGTGKSHLAKTVAKTAKEKGLKVAYLEAAELFNMIKGTFGHDRHNEMLFNEYKSFDLVVIDDVGLETKKRDEISWSVSEWTKIINAREGKATVFTTNFDDTSLGEVVGQRAFSRMYMNTRFIDLFTDDYRKNMRV